MKEALETLSDADRARIRAEAEKTYALSPLSRDEQIRYAEAMLTVRLLRKRNLI